MPAKKKQPSTEQVELYEKLLATHPEMERKGDANPYTSYNGNMYTLLHQSMGWANLKGAAMSHADQVE